MKKYYAFASALLFSALIGCKENEEPVIDEPNFEETESEWIRLAHWNEEAKIGLLNPTNNNNTQPDLSPFHADGANYLSSSGRYIVSIERVDGKVRFFDTGIENHNDHGHEYTPKWITATANAPLPTHFSTTNGQIIIFNDGDGSVTWARESTLETPSFSPTIISNIGNGVHHGAATWLTGNKFAVTFKDENASGSLPQRVKLIDNTGQVIYQNEAVTVTGIHGDASNGKYAIFGAAEGVIVASDNNQIKLIPNPSPLNATSGNWMGTIKANDNINTFYGYARQQGIFEINPAMDAITPVLLSNTIKTYFLSADGGYLIVQLNDNTVKVFDTANRNEVASKSIASAEASVNPTAKTANEWDHYRLMNEDSPILTASENFLYVLSPDKKKIDIKSLSNLNTLKTIDAPSNTSNILRVGFQTK
ncbi:hypothetical protein ACFOUP_13845 [Belliella kenyensis]|uniref:Bulb-type lectin domain-containing protein n=1 Tax=Belliella kenyensis TaxID=1472724 RepID=A0ABV8EQ51_9BACT|nr:hypothetical protein [Belliella kenyensis]MCH7401525.1 hypothetical protein [Belliella kenyensis]MDN3603195.1 hypothetical protein [Belliella kenyensis]